MFRKAGVKLQSSPPMIALQGHLTSFLEVYWLAERVQKVIMLWGCFHPMVVKEN